MTSLIIKPGEREREDEGIDIAPDPPFDRCYNTGVCKPDKETIEQYCDTEHWYECPRLQSMGERGE